MTKTILYYFVDTNLFIQCLPLESLDWSTFHEFEEVCLIVSSPVLREIDHLKNRGNDRVGRQARKASATFREMLDDAKKVVHTQCPRVVLSIEPQHTCSRDLERQLDLQERDDQLLGIIYEFRQSNPSKEVRLLTHDTTPLYKARGLGITADRISDDWLRPPESTKAERRLTALEAENARLKSAEPSLSIRCTDQTNAEIDRLYASFTWFEPLTDTQVDALMQRLRARFPLATKFGSKDTAEPPPPPSLGDQLFGIKPTFVPATDEEIRNYRDAAYPDWLKSCKDMLRSHHQTLQHDIREPEFTFLAQNAGTRPATDVLVTIEAQGGFMIKPPSPNDEVEELEEQNNPQFSLKFMRLPQPPNAPRGRWQRTTSMHPVNAPHALSRLGCALKALPEHDHPDLALARPGRVISPYFPPDPIDPNDFYYKPARPLKPQESFAIECAQWRHGNQAEAFRGKIHVPKDSGEIKGLLVCRIQAANLSQSISSKLRVRITISRTSALESAREMVETLIEFPEHQIGISLPQPGATD